MEMFVEFKTTSNTAFTGRIRYAYNATFIRNERMRPPGSSSCNVRII
jgi:hypothetical protein